ncbi:MAG: iron ABC transporter permease [Flavobacteriaceae bacterium]|nr:iron ABC transporter permease [Flavobacteriaceae bacterium]
MNPIKTSNFNFLLLAITLLVFLILNLSLGSVSIPPLEILKNIIGIPSDNSTWTYIITQYRLPKAITAVLVGSGLSACGLLMQTLFRNPMAGPYVLGISSGASLGVALLILGSSILGGKYLALGNNQIATVIAGILGAMFILITVMAVSSHIKNTMALLIIGLMFGSFTTAVISILSYFSSAQNLQQYIFWSFGSLGNTGWSALPVLSGIYLLCLLWAIPNIKSLNALLLGENYAKSLGLSIPATRNQILIITGVLTGVITAFAGPIAFVGLAVPHITKMLLQTSNHKVLFPAVLLIGAIVMLICDTIAQIPNSAFVLPINAITSLFGAPVVIWLLMKKRKLS